MHTLFDFISNVNGNQYGLALIFMLGFVIFREILSCRPFGGLVKAISEDVAFLKEQKGKIVRVIKNAALAPLCGLLYVAAVPLLFVHGIAVLFSKVIAATTAIGWSPMQAYFANRKKEN